MRESEPLLWNWRGTGRRDAKKQREKSCTWYQNAVWFDSSRTGSTIVSCLLLPIACPPLFKSAEDVSIRYVWIFPYVDVTLLILLCSVEVGLARTFLIIFQLPRNDRQAVAYFHQVSIHQFLNFSHPFSSIYVWMIGAYVNADVAAHYHVSRSSVCIRLAHTSLCATVSRFTNSIQLTGSNENTAYSITAGEFKILF